MQDVLTANEDGTISVLLSSVPAAHPDPAADGHADRHAYAQRNGYARGHADSDRDAVRQTPDDDRARPTTPRPARPRVTPVNTPKEGAFELSGGGCSIDEQLRPAARRGRRAGAAAGPDAVWRAGRRTDSIRRLRSFVRRHCRGRALHIVHSSGAGTGSAQLRGLQRRSRRARRHHRGAARRRGRRFRPQPLARSRADRQRQDRHRAHQHRALQQGLVSGGDHRQLPSAAQGPAAVAVTLFNNDVTLDLAVAQRSARNVAIFTGDGTGNFAAPRRRPLRTPSTTR